MLTRIVMMVIIVGSEIDTLVVKLFYLDKFLPEQSSVVGLAEEKFCRVSFVNDSKATFKKRKISWKQSFLLVLIFANPFPANVTFLYPPKKSMMLAKKSTRMQLRQKMFGFEAY